MNFSNKILISFIFIVSTFFIGNIKTAFGAVIFSDVNTSNNDYWLTSGSWSGSCYGNYPYGGNGTYRLKNLFAKNIYKITVYACKTAQNQTDVNFTLTGTGFSADTTYRSTSVLPDCGTGFLPIDVYNNNVVDISEEEYLYFYFKPVLYGNNTFATASSSIAQDTELVRYCTRPTYDQFSSKNLAIDIYGDYLTSDYVNFVEPADNAIIKNFSLWYVDTKIKTLTSDYTLQIMYQKDGYSSIYYDLTGIPIYNNEITRITIPKTGIPNMTDGSYSATAFLLEYDGTTDYIRASSSISFVVDNINGATSSFDKVDWSALDNINTVCNEVATSSGTYFDDFRFGIECGARKVLYWTFNPSPQSVQKVIYSFNNLKVQFPFNAFFGLTDIVKTSLATSTNTTGTIQMPFINKTGHYVMLDVLSSSSLPNLIGGTNANLFRNSLSWVMYCLTAFVVFITFKKI